MVTLRFIGKRWKPAVLWKIKEGNQRFKLLKTSLPYISDKMLSETLRELENDGLLTKRTYKEVPLRTEYSMTDFGLSLYSVLQEMNTWGDSTKKRITKAKRI